MKITYVRAINKPKRSRGGGCQPQCPTQEWQAPLYREEWRLQPRAAGVAILRQGQNGGVGTSSTAADPEMDLPPAPSPVLPAFSKPSSSPAFQPAQELVIPHRCPSWRKTKGRSLPACQGSSKEQECFLPLLPTSCISTPLSASISLTLRAGSTFP